MIQLVFQVNYVHNYFFNLAKLKNKQMTKILTYKKAIWKQLQCCEHNRLFSIKYYFIL